MLYLTYWKRVYGEANDTHFSHLMSLQNAIVRISARASPKTPAGPLNTDRNIRNIKKLYLHTMSLFQ